MLYTHFFQSCLHYRLVRQSERFNWAATQGVNEDMLLDKLPEDLQRKIRRHLFKFVKKVFFSVYIYIYILHFKSYILHLIYIISCKVMISKVL